MRIYLELCCLKRPFDDQKQPHAHVESEAVLSIMAAEGDQVEFVRSRAHHLENEQNPDGQRAERVREWLSASASPEIDDALLTSRTAELAALGFKNFDAFHLASAEMAGTDVFSSCDDRLLAAARRHSTSLKVRVVDPVSLLRELNP